jgi:Zn-dependent protease
MAQAGVLTNLVMFAFNLFPIPPMDGGRIVVGLLPWRLAVGFWPASQSCLVRTIVWIPSSFDAITNPARSAPGFTVTFCSPSFDASSRLLCCSMATS